MAVGAVASTAAVLVAGSTAEASAVALSMAVTFVVAVLVGAITDSIMMSSSAVSAFPGGVGATRTDITVTAITRTVIMDTAHTHTATTTDTADTVTMVGRVTDTAMAADERISGVGGVGDMPGYGSLKYRRPVGV